MPAAAACKASAIVQEVHEPQLPSPTTATSLRARNAAYSSAARRPSSPVRPQLRQNSTSAPSARRPSAQMSATQSQERQSMSIRTPTRLPCSDPASGPGAAMSSARLAVGSNTIAVAICRPPHQNKMHVACNFVTIKPLTLGAARPIPGAPEDPRSAAITNHSNSLAATPVERPELLTERVVERIRDAILSGRLAPGARLSVPELARQLGVSRTPVRESLLVLEREGLAVQRPTSGLAVIAGNADDMRDLLDLREGLEAIAARRAAERMTAEEVAGLNAALQEHQTALATGDLAAHVALDGRFHQLIREGARNPRLERQLVQIEQQSRVLNSRLSRAAGWSAKAVIRDHTAIAEAIAARDPDRAEASLRRHVDRTRSFYAVSDANP